MSARKIITVHEYPPIPDRSMDWSATLEGYDEGDPIGQGAAQLGLEIGVNGQANSRAVDRRNQLD